MKLGLLLLPIFSADAESKEENSKNIFNALHQGRFDRTRRNPKWDDIWGISSKTSGLSLKTHHIPPIDVVSHKKFVNHTEGFIGKVSESLSKARESIKQEAKLLSNEINYFRESLYPTTEHSELKPTEKDIPSIWNFPKRRFLSGIALPEMTRSGIPRYSGDFNFQETEYSEKSSSYDSMGLQLLDYVYDHDRTNEFLIDVQDSKKFENSIIKNGVLNGSIEYANDILNSDGPKLNFDINGLPIEEFNGADDQLKNRVNDEKPSPDIAFPELNLENLGLLNVTIKVTATTESKITTESPSVTDTTTTSMDVLTEIDLTHNFDDNGSFLIDEDYFHSDEQLQQVIDTTERSPTTSDSTIQIESTRKETEIGKINTNDHLTNYKVVLDHKDWGCNVFSKTEEEPLFDFNTPHILNLISAREKHEREIFTKFHRCACDDSNQNCRFQTGIEFFSHFSKKVIERKLNKFQALFGKILAYDGETVFSIINEFPVWSSRATHQFDNQYSMGLRFFDWSCEMNGKLLVEEVQAIFDKPFWTRIFDENSVTVAVSSSCGTDGLIVIFDLETNMTEHKLKEILDNRIHEISSLFNYDGYSDYQILSKITKETAVDMIEPENTTPVIISKPIETLSSTNKNFAEHIKYEEEKESHDDFDWEDLSDRQMINELAVCMEHAYDILDPFSIFQNDLVFIITIRKILSKQLFSITKSNSGKHSCQVSPDQSTTSRSSQPNHYFCQ